MALFSEKINKKMVKSIANTLVLALVLAVLVNPTATYAKSDGLGILSFIFGQNNEEKRFPQASDREPDKKVISVITAYTSTPDQTDDSPFIAATGKRVYDGMIAANWLPFGTKIKIPELYGDKVFTVDDRMNSRYGYGRMDIWLDVSKAEAKKFGVKRVEVEIYYSPKTEQLAKID